MKRKLFFLTRITVILLFTSINYSYLYGQQRNLRTELLVYILPDSLELPLAEKGNIGYEKAIIASKSLKTALDKIRPLAIGKAFPEWNAADSIKIREDGTKVKAPQFGRIFTLTFKSEEEANAAMEVLKKLPAVLFAEKNSQPKLHADPAYDNDTMASE